MSVNGKDVQVRADCICVHSDTPNAIELAQAVKTAVADYLELDRRFRGGLRGMAQHEVLSPLPGIFYRRPAPEKPPYKEDGDRVADGDIIGLIEVMKQFTEVHADAGGKIVRFLVDNEAPVEPGQPVLLIETA